MVPGSTDAISPCAPCIIVIIIISSITTSSTLAICPTHTNLNRFRTVGSGATNGIIGSGPVAPPIRCISKEHRHWRTRRGNSHGNGDGRGLLCGPDPRRRLFGAGVTAAIFWLKTHGHLEGALRRCQSCRRGSSSAGVGAPNGDGPVQQMLTAPPPVIEHQ